MLHILETRMSLPVKIEDVFSFFCNAENLERITPPELHFQITTPHPLCIQQGSLIDYRLQLYHVSFRWQTRISLWEPPRKFIDEQVAGPYKLWIHSHNFHEVDGGTAIVDEIQYRLPFEPFGEIFHPLVRRQLERIFHFRETAIHSALKAPDQDHACNNYST